MGRIRCFARRFGIPIRQMHHKWLYFGLNGNFFLFIKRRGDIMITVSRKFTLIVICMLLLLWGCGTPHQIYFIEPVTGRKG